MAEVAARKIMTTGEGGLALTFAVMAFVCLIGAAKAEDVAFAFHTYLAAAASCAAVLAIFNREASIIETITTGRSGVMPAWSDRLDPATINALAVYVHTLGGGQ